MEELKNPIQVVEKAAICLFQRGGSLFEERYPSWCERHFIRHESTQLGRCKMELQEVVYQVLVKETESSGVTQMEENPMEVMELSVEVPVEEEIRHPNLIFQIEVNEEERKRFLLEERRRETPEVTLLQWRSLTG